jgi:hypothetical protein
MNHHRTHFYNSKYITMFVSLLGWSSNDFFLNCMRIELYNYNLLLSGRDLMNGVCYGSVHIMNVSLVVSSTANISWILKI